MIEDIAIAEYLDPIDERHIAILAITLSLLSVIGSLFIIII